MRNLKLQKLLRCSELRGPGIPQCFSVRNDIGTVLVASEYGITELDPRSAQVGVLAEHAETVACVEETIA